MISQGIGNVNILVQQGPSPSKYTTFKKIVESNNLTQNYVNLKTVLKTGKSLNISESEVCKIVQNDFKYDYDYASDKVKIRPKNN